jgi:excinuclease UvrABC nuclease subunit
MIKGRFRNPYKNNKTNLPGLTKKSGVYVIKENDKIVYIGYSESNLYKTLYRHFQSWNHPFQEVITYAGKRKNYSVRVVLCSPAKAARLERALIMKHQPRDNAMKYKGYSAKAADKRILDEYIGAPVVSNEDLPF